MLDFFCSHFFLSGRNNSEKKLSIWKTGVIRISAIFFILASLSSISFNYLEIINNKDSLLIGLIFLMATSLMMNLFIPSENIHKNLRFFPISLCLVALFSFRLLGFLCFSLFLYSLPFWIWMVFGRRASLVLVFMNISLFSFFYITPAFMVNISDIFEIERINNVNLLGFIFFNLLFPMIMVLKSRVGFSKKRKKERELKELKKNSELFKGLFEKIGGPGIICSNQGIILRVNNDLLEITGHAMEDLKGKKISRLGLKSEFKMGKGTQAQKIRIIKKDKTTMECLVKTGETGCERFNLITFAETPQEMKISDSPEKFDFDGQKYFDQMTGLPNREYLLLKLREYLYFIINNEKIFSVVCIRPAHFNYIEQKYGSVIANTLLKKIGNYLKAYNEEHYCLAKLRGISFSLVTRPYENEEEAENEVLRIFKNLPSKIEISGISLDLSFYCGVSICPKDSTQAEEILKYSELARNYAKISFASKPVFFKKSLSTSQVEQVEVEILIKKAIEEDGFYVVYQPKVDPNGQIVSTEALVRMKSNDEAKQFGPDVFIPVAEKSGLITRVEDIVIKKVLGFIRNRISLGKKLVPVSINISGMNIGNLDFADDFIGLLEEYGVPSEFVEIEITETALMMGEELARDNMRKLKQNGINISIDDFGTGYSSLGKLIDLPVDTLKIDKSFLEKIPEDVKNISLIKTILNLGTQLNLKIIAEGVETEGQKNFLIGNGGHEFQGYYFYRPLSENQFGREIDSIDFSLMGNSRLSGCKKAIILN